MFRFPLCLLLSFELCELVKSFGPAAMLGPVDMIFQRMEQCNPEFHLIDFWVSQRKFNRTTNVLDITWKSPHDIDDSVQIELKGSLKKEGGYKPGAFYFKERACIAMEKMLGDMFTGVLKTAGLEKCPLPPGEFSSPGFYFDNEKFDVPQIYGEYKMEIFVYKDDELQSCFIAFYEMQEKDDK